MSSQAILDNSRYGCHNTERKDGYWVRDMVRKNEYPQGDGWKWIENTMSRECRYDMWNADKKCEGCEK